MKNPNEKTGLEIGTKTWFMGEEVTITTEAYNLYGGRFQDATTEDGTVKTLIVKEKP